LREDPGKNSWNVLGFVEGWKHNASDWFCHLPNCGLESWLGATRSEEFALLREGVHP
jgi:hypothetical protein